MLTISTGMRLSLRAFIVFCATYINTNWSYHRPFNTIVQPHNHTNHGHILPIISDGNTYGTPGVCQVSLLSQVEGAKWFYPHYEIRNVSIKTF